jgi:hypothetical protein
VKDDALAVAGLTIGLRLRQQPAADQASIQRTSPDINGREGHIDARID